MPMGPEQLYHAMDPLKEVDVKALDEIAKSLKSSRSKQKRAVGVFLDRINRYRMSAEPSRANPSRTKPPRKTPETELKDLSE